MRIAVDAMGGDHAPEEIVRGALEAAKLQMAEILLVGNQLELESLVHKLGSADLVSIVDARESVSASEAPAYAVHKKSDSSIMVATSLVKEGRADALISAGSTGAQMASALLCLGRLPGIKRPAIATVIPTLGNPLVLIDSGANTQCSAENLWQFALMGSKYAELILGCRQPRVALLNIGSEENKGTETVKQAYQLLRSSELGFIGNIEGRELMQGGADVVVCDGFTGNIVLKVIEGASLVFLKLLADFLGSGRAGQQLDLAELKQLRRRFDYSSYGGAPLLGVNGISVICHGSSKAQAITSAIKVAVDCVKQRLVDKLHEGVPWRGDDQVAVQE